VQTDKGHQEQREQQNFFILAKKIQRTFQQNYSYQGKGQRS